MQFNYPDFEELNASQVLEYFSVAPESRMGEMISRAHKALLEDVSPLPSGLAVMDILLQLGVDEPICLAALWCDPRLREIPEQEIADNDGDVVCGLVHSVRWLNSLTNADKLKIAAPEQAEHVRRLLVQAVSDVRSILIKLAYRVERMRKLAQEPRDVQLNIARNTMDIYAPLANRLGIGQLKWELEDFSLRFLEPDLYKTIAANLEERRVDREHYLQIFVQEVEMLLNGAGIKAEVSGRPKHIYSIAKKMRKKSLSFDQLYDVRAVRIIVDSLADCYAVLGLAHNHWHHLPSEFDDYISRPKDNGYQSLHTVVMGEQGKAVEIQIRTQEMHERAESGVAAHWAYKESAQGNDIAFENNIQALRQLLDADELDEELLHQFQSESKSGRVFVFTPKGEVVDLEAGATPLDFAYSIHTEIGHRCRGAKVNGRIVPLNTELSDADKVEIITGKEAAPTREWANPNLGYIRSSHVRAKVRGWFNKRDYQQNVEDGGYIFERELNRFHGRAVSDIDYVQHFGRDSVEDMLADIGRGAISNNQLLAAIQLLNRPKEQAIEDGRRRKAPKEGEIEVLGVGNLMTHRAQCCLPISGDAIIGFITQGRGVSVHREDCKNIQNLSVDDTQRLIPVSWGMQSVGGAEVQLLVEAYDREGLMRDVSSVLSREHIYLNAVNTQSDRQNQTAHMRLTIELKNTHQLGLIIDKLLQIPNVYQVERVVF